MQLTLNVRSLGLAPIVDLITIIFMHSSTDDDETKEEKK